jgi:SAM-dependent methyltransferase
MSEHHGEILFTPQYWDDRYRSADQLWSGRPNSQLVAQAADLPLGDALDVGCGEGADAIWLASRGWRVTAVDVSNVALERAARHAALLGDEVASRITWRQADMYSWDPGQSEFDLVSAQFMYLPPAAFAEMYGRLAAAVRPRGTLLLVGHNAEDLRAHNAEAADMAWSAQQLAPALDPADWEILLAGEVKRPAADAAHSARHDGPAHSAGNGAAADSVRHDGPAHSAEHGGPAHSAGNGAAADSARHGAAADSVRHDGPADSVRHGAAADSVRHDGPADSVRHDGPAHSAGHGGPAHSAGHSGPAGLTGPHLADTVLRARRRG